MNATHDYYKVLGVSPDATEEQIRSAYRRRIAEVHPDKPGGDAEQARLLELARAVLLNPVKRAEYDTRRLGGDLLDEAVSALTEVGERAVDRLGAAVQARGRDLLGVLRRRAVNAIRSPRRR